MAKKKIFKGKWTKKNNRWYYIPANREGFRYGFGDYFGMNMSNKEIKMYERLHDLEEKARKLGLTPKEKKRFKELSNWAEED